MYVKSPAIASGPLLAIGHRRPIFWRRPAGAALLVLVVSVDTAFLGAATWLGARELAFISYQRFVSLLAIYSVVVVCLAIWVSGTTWTRDRLMFVVALIIGSGAATGAPILQDARGLFLWLGCACLSVLLSDRVTFRARRRAGAWLRPVRTIAFVGNSLAAARMLVQLRMESEAATDLVGFFDDRSARGGPLSDQIPRIGGVDDVVAYLQENSLSEIFIALPWSASQRMAQLLERLRFLPLTVRLIPEHLPPSLIATNRQRVDDVVMPTLMVPPFTNVGGFIKRVIDLSVSCVLIVPLAFLFIILACLIKLDSRGTVFFRQARSGQFGRSFMIYKFRTLHSSQQDAAAETLVTRGDVRVTRVGRILRKYSIDELPQIFNVLLGHMSLVGPRPHAPRAKANGRIYSEVLPDYALRYRVKPGMTGWAQVNGWRGNTDTEDQLRRRVEFDFEYIDKWSILHDIIILARTLPSMLIPPPTNA